MKTLTTTNTAEVLAAMFTENTGAHFLDSGGAYGRNYERHAGKTARDFLNAPAVNNCGDYFTVNAFHWLNDRLSYSPVMDSAFQTYLDQSEEHYLTDMEEFPTTLGAENIYTINTYNGDDALDQTLQFTQFEVGGRYYYALQVHGGCDVRGGYTRPRIFEGDDCALYDFERVSVRCYECGFSVDYWASRVEDSCCGDACGPWCGNVNNQIPTDEPPTYAREWKPSDGCPCCKSPLGN